MFGVLAGDRFVVGYGEAQKWWILAGSRSVSVVVPPSPRLGFRPILRVWVGWSASATLETKAPTSFWGARGAGSVSEGYARPRLFLVSL